MIMKRASNFPKLIRIFEQYPGGHIFITPLMTPTYGQIMSKAAVLSSSWFPIAICSARGASIGTPIPPKKAGAGLACGEVDVGRIMAENVWWTTRENCAICAS